MSYVRLQTNPNGWRNVKKKKLSGRLDTSDSKSAQVPLILLRSNHMETTLVIVSSVASVVRNGLHIYWIINLRFISVAYFKGNVC